MKKNFLIGLLTGYCLLFTVSSNSVFAQSPTPTPSPSVTPSPKPSGLYIPQPSMVKINDIGVLIGAVFAALLIFSAVLTFLFLIMGGIQWITSGGDKAGLEAARNKIVNAIVGLIIVASAWAIMLLVQNFLGIDIFGGTATLPKPFPEVSATPLPTPTPTPSPTPAGFGS